MNLQNMVSTDLSKINSGAVRNVDIVFVIDATGSMETLINKVKSNVQNFYNKVEEALKEQNKKIGVFRAKIIAFRDYYCDGNDAMVESDNFFILPEQSAEFERYLDGIEAKGGGDAPESSLEALALAMKSDFTPREQGQGCPRHIIALFTDSSAHPFQNDFNEYSSSDDKSNNAASKNPIYPKDMFKSLEELKNAWYGQNENGYAMMEKDAKRLLLFTPCNDCYPWNDFAASLENCAVCAIQKDGEFDDLDMQVVTNIIGNSAK